MKSTAFTLLLFCWTAKASSQSSITGRITAANGKPVPFVNVLLLDLNDSSLIKGSIANESGEYEVGRIKKGRYFLRYCAIGYRTFNSAAVELTGSPENKDFGTLEMELDSNKKKNVELGTKGSFSLTGMYGYREKGDVSVELAHNTEKTGIYGSYSFLHDRSYSDYFATGYQVAPSLGGAMNFDFWDTQKNTMNRNNALLGMDTRFKKTTIGAIIVFNSSNMSSNIFNHAQYTLFPDSVLLMNSTIHQNNRWRNRIAGFYAERRIREGEKINMDIGYLDYTNNNPTVVQNSFLDDKGGPVISNDSVLSPRHNESMSERIQTGVTKIDYVKQLHKTARLEAGIKESYSQSASLSSIASLVDNEWVTSAETTNDLLMKEEIGAAYVYADFQLAPSAGLAVGGRYEYSHTILNNQYNGENLVDRRLGELLPSIVFSKAINDKASWQLSYTKWLTRPSYNDLLSFIAYNDPISVGIGNPLLRPTITNELKAEYSYKGYFFSLLASRDDYPIAGFQVSANSSGSLLYITSENLRYQNSLILQSDIPLQVSKWWSTIQGFSGGWRRYLESFTKEELEKTYFAYSVYTRQVFKLPGDLSLELSGRYNSASYNGTAKIDPNKSMNAAISKHLKHNKGSFQFSVDDVFRSIQYTSHYGTLTEETYSLKSHLTYDPESRKYTIFKLSYTRPFGNDHLKSHKKDIGAQEEWPRVGR